VIHALSIALFGTSLAIDEFPVRHDLKGIGLSDSHFYAPLLPAKLDYTNTFYDRYPRLDVTDPPANLTGRLDFVIASDVFEHIPPPIERAFEGVHALLKPGGAFVMTVPYSQRGETEEHYPNLHEYEVMRRRGGHVVVNRTREGRLEMFENPVFHGGIGVTLEMRVFSRPSLLRHLRDAGFAQTTELTGGWLQPRSGFPMLARR
jgi:SAM-dependent methyltransferase